MNPYGRLPTLNEQEILLAVYSGRMGGRPPAYAVAKMTERGFFKPESDKLGRPQLTSVAVELVKFCIKLGLMSSASIRQGLDPETTPDDPVADDEPPPRPVIPPPVIPPTVIPRAVAYAVASPAPLVVLAPAVNPHAIKPTQASAPPAKLNGTKVAAPVAAPKGPPVKRPAFQLTPLMRQRMRQK
jgi:hypothetical protein